MRYAYVPISAQVECEDCEWKSESYKNAQAIAKIHAKKHGHKVRGELTISSIMILERKKRTAEKKPRRLQNE